MLAQLREPLHGRAEEPDAKRHRPPPHVIGKPLQCFELRLLDDIRRVESAAQLATHTPVDCATQPLAMLAEE
jgi:hypothetical protein